MTPETRYSTFNTETGEFMEVLPMDEIADMIKYKFAQERERNESLLEHNKELENGIFKDRTIAQLNEQLEDFKRGFPITAEQQEAINRWVEQHEKVHKGGHGAAGGKYSYIFTPTGIGTFASIKCTCGKSFDFSDDNDF